jgi:hypothetical protein
MVVDFIKCPICKEKINSFYACTGICPACSGIFTSTRQKESLDDLKQIRKDKKKHIDETMSKNQIKKMFNLKDKEISKIPSSIHYNKVRYEKVDVIKFINDPSHLQQKIIFH